MQNFFGKVKHGTENPSTEKEIPLNSKKFISVEFQIL